MTFSLEREPFYGNKVESMFLLAKEERMAELPSLTVQTVRKPEFVALWTISFIYGFVPFPTLTIFRRITPVTFVQPQPSNIH
jgi:hypothetical protein